MMEQQQQRRLHQPIQQCHLRRRQRCSNTVGVGMMMTMTSVWQFFLLLFSLSLSSNTLLFSSLVSAQKKDGECLLVSLLPFTSTYKVPADRYNITTNDRNQYNLLSPVSISRLSFAYTATMIIAMEHFNTRNTSIVKELYDGSTNTATIRDNTPLPNNATTMTTTTTIDALQNCSIYFNDAPIILDTQTNGGISIQSLYSAVDILEEKPCAVLGTPLQQQINHEMIPAINTYQIPIITYHTDDTSFTSYTEDQNTMALSFSVDGMVKAMVQYIQSRQFLAYLYITDPTSTPHFIQHNMVMSETLVQYGNASSLKVEVFRIKEEKSSTTSGSSSNTKDDKSTASSPSTANTVDVQMKRLKDSGIKTIYLSVGQPIDLVRYANILQQYDLFTSDYIYILPSDVVPTDFVNVLYGTYNVASVLPKDHPPIFKLLSGALVFDKLDPFRIPSSQQESSKSSVQEASPITADNSTNVNATTNTTRPSTYDTFLQIWMEQGNATVDKINAYIPESAYYTASPTYFQTVLPPPNLVSYVYDAVMTIGIGACIAQKEQAVMAQELLEQGIDPNSVDDFDDNDTVNRTALKPFFGFIPNTEAYDESILMSEDSSILSTQRSAQDGRHRRNRITTNDVDDHNSTTIYRQLQTTTTSSDTATNVGKVERGTLLDGMLKSNFTGASGHVEFGKESGKERNSDTIRVGIYNIRPENVGSTSTTAGSKNATNSTFNSNNSTMGSSLPNQTFYAHLVLLYDSESNVWNKADDTSAIVYRDGTTDTPTITREFVNENYLSKGVRVFGLLLMGIAWTFALLALIALHKFTKDPVIQRAQPFFLKMLCIGSIIMSTAILTLSFDENVPGWDNDNKLNAACTMTPWFFFIGQIVTFCSLFTKLWRVDKVLQFRRRAVTISNVMKPCIAIISICVTILILWTVIDPWKWERIVISDVPAERYGECTSRYFWVWFGPLLCLLFFAEAVTMYFAWKTADVPNDFRDSGAVMYASFAQIQSWAIGVPMLAVLGNTSADATYFGRIFLIWIFAVSSVVVVIGPKLITAYRIRRNPELGKAKSRVHVSGLTNPLPNQQPGGQYQAFSSSVNTSSVNNNAGYYRSSSVDTND